MFWITRSACTFIEKRVVKQYKSLRHSKDILNLKLVKDQCNNINYIISYKFVIMAFNYTLQDTSLQFDLFPHPKDIQALNRKLDRGNNFK